MSLMTVGVKLSVSSSTTSWVVNVSVQRSWQTPVPRGSMGRLRLLHREYRPKTCCLSLTFWSIRATYSSLLPPTLALVTKLFWLVKGAPTAFGAGHNRSSAADVRLIAELGITLPGNCTRGEVSWPLGPTVQGPFSHWTGL